MERTQVLPDPYQRWLCKALHSRCDWLFCDTCSGVQASATLYSLIETTKANGHEPYAYLRHVLTYLPCASCIENFEALLPFNIDPARITHYLATLR